MFNIRLRCSVPAIRSLEWQDVWNINRWHHTSKCCAILIYIFGGVWLLFIRSELYQFRARRVILFQCDDEKRQKFYTLRVCRTVNRFWVLTTMRSIEWMLVLTKWILFTHSKSCYCTVQNHRPSFKSVHYFNSVH